VKPEDVIVAVDGKPIKDGQGLVNHISDQPIGSQVTITVLRDKKKQDLKVTVGDRNEVVNTASGGERPGTPEKSDATPAKFGISIQNMTPARKEAMNFSEKGGVLVEQVQPGSFAEDIGLADNDVVLSINRQPVDSVEDVKRIQGTLKPGDPVAFRVMRSAVPLARSRGTNAKPEWRSLFVAGTMPNTQ